MAASHVECTRLRGATSDCTPGGFPQRGWPGQYLLSRLSAASGRSFLPLRQFTIACSAGLSSRGSLTMPSDQVLEFLQPDDAADKPKRGSDRAYVSLD